MTLRRCPARAWVGTGVLAPVCLALSLSHASAVAATADHEPQQHHATRLAPSLLAASHPAYKALTRAQLTLDAQSQPRFLLHYDGPPLELRGSLCYRFAGYSETCARVKGRWLTRAEPMKFLAPGQVPPDLLQGYRLELRLPALFETPFQYDVQEPTPSARGSNSPSNRDALSPHVKTTQDLEHERSLHP